MTFKPTLHRRGRSGLLAAVALSGAVLIGAMPAALRAETLQDAIAAAYLQNPALRQDRFRQKARNEEYVQTRSQYGPVLDINSRAVFRNSRLRGQSENTDSGEVTARLRQPLYTGGRLRGSLARRGRTSCRASRRCGRARPRRFVT
jgi:outer membrane protein/S-layer protein transport system outer membrane protein